MQRIVFAIDITNSALSIVMNQSAFSWNDLVKKKATGIDYCDIGQIQEIKSDVIVTRKGILDKMKFYLPKNLVVGFDRHSVYFRILKAEATQFQRNNDST